LSDAAVSFADTAGISAWRPTSARPLRKLLTA